MRNGIDGVTEYRAAFVIGRFVVTRDGQRAKPHARVADDVGVVVIANPCGFALIDRQHGVERLARDSVAKQHAVFGRERVVKPVVSDGEGVRHLRGIGEYRRVPVAEARRRTKFGDCTPKIGITLCDPIHQSERAHPVENPAADSAQARPCKFVLRRRSREKPLTLLLEIQINAVRERIVANQTMQAIEIGIQQNQARM